MEHLSINVFYKLILLFWMCIGRHAQSIESNMFSTSLQYLQKKVGDEVDFLFAGKRMYFDSKDVHTRHGQITQSNKFAISLQYLQRDMGNEIDCLLVDKHKRFL